MLYDVNTHPRLNTKAVALQASSQAAFEAHVLQAEGLLALSTPVVTVPRLVELLKIAVVLQINWQLTWDADPYAIRYERADVTQESVGYKDDVPLVNPQAAAIVAQVNAELGDPNPSGLWADGLASIRGPRG